jgi:cytochrome P450
MTEHALAAEAVVTELFFTPEGRADPYPRYHQLRELAPVFRSEKLQAWLLTRYEDCKSALRDPRFEKHFAESLDTRAPGWRERPGLQWSSRTMLNLDAPEHTRLRRLVVREFTPRTVEMLRPQVEAMVDDLLDAMVEHDVGELMDELAFKLPISVIGMLLGVPAEDRPQFRELTQRLTAVFELGATRDMLDAADAAVLECNAYFDKLIAERRAEPRDDLLSRLIAEDATTGIEAGETDHLTNEELNTLSALLFLAGFETTTNLIGNGMISLLSQPDQMEALRSQPELCANVADELLRHDGTVQLTSRFATTDVAFGDVTVPAGEAVFIVLGAANRDPERYPEPDRVDFTRTKVQPLAFGGGVHLCLGAPLARLEIEIVFRKLAERFDAIELSGDLPPHRDRLTLRAPTAVPLKLRTPGAQSQPLPARPAGDDTQWRADYRRHMDAQKAALDPRERKARIALLQRVPFFRHCSGPDVAALAATAYPISFDPGEQLCVEGNVAPDLYVIAAGEADVVIGGEVVGDVGADDVVGERGVVLDERRAATVTATSHMITYAISRELLQQVLDRSPDVLAAMQDDVRRRYS